MTLDDQIREIVRAETDQLRAEVEQLKAANSAPPALAFTVKEVAERFLPGTAEPTIREWIKSGALPAHVSPGGRVYLVLADDLRTFLRDLPAAAKREQDRAPSVDGSIRRILSRHAKVG